MTLENSLSVQRSV